jgi:hypothetical protein
MLGGVERKHRRLGRSPPHAGRQVPTSVKSQPRRRRPKSLAGVVCGGMTGFVLGATFWSVLGLQELPGSEAPRLSPLPEPQNMHAPDCTSLTLDRRQGSTTAEPCQVLPLREAHATELGGRSLR